LTSEFDVISCVLLADYHSCLSVNQLKVYVYVMQLENNVEFHEFLEVHKSKSNKSAWVNDIVLPASEKYEHKKDKSANKTNSSDVEKHEAAEKTGTRKPEQKKKLSDLEASYSF